MAAEARNGSDRWSGREEHLAALGRALSDPARVRILALLARGRACCAGVARAAAEAPDNDAVCVCELQAVLGMRQSLVSYHLRLLREAGLVSEERRGRWSFYSLERAAVSGLAAELAALAGGNPGAGPDGAPPGLAPGARGREVQEMAFAGKREEEVRSRPQGGFVEPTAGAGCCGETACCGGDAGTAGQASTCCGEQPPAPTCC